METIFALLEKGASLEALESSVQILQDRLRGKGDVFEAAESAVRFARMLTTMDPKARTKGEEVDRVLLRLLGHDKLGLGDDLDASQLKTACRQILWNEAIPYFKEKVWDRAFALFNVRGLYQLVLGIGKNKAQFILGDEGFWLSASLC